jgi:protease-4
MRLIGRIVLWGFALVGMAVTLAGAVAIVAAVYFSSQGAEAPDRIVLRFDLDRELVDGRGDGDPWRAVLGEPPLTLRGVVTALDAAGRDGRVIGLSVRLGGQAIGIATAQELRQAIARFRARGKFALAYARSFAGMGDGTPEYYLAAAFDEIWMQPSGTLALTGIALEIPFLRDALEKIGVRPEFEQRHEYKAAVETFTRAGISRPARQSLERVLESWMRQILGGIAADRKIPVPQLRALIDRAPLLAAEARDAGLIDALGYRDEYLTALRARGGVALDLSRYASAPADQAEAAAAVALVYGVGPIESGGDGDGLFESKRFSAARVAGAIVRAAEDPAIRAIVLRIDSPGGSYVASDTVRRAVLRARALGKVVIASMGEYAASGGYFAAMAADKIVAQPGTLTGSIGVFGGKFATEALWRKLGVQWSRIAVGANAGMWSAIRPFPPSAAARHRAVIDAIYGDFTAKLASDRGIAADRIDAVARGRVWTGADALEIGLVDALGGLSEALALAREALDLAADARLEVILFPETRSPLERLRRAVARGVPLTGAVAGLLLAGTRIDPLAALARRLEPVTGDLSILRPPAGLLQLPPFRLVR